MNQPNQIDQPNQPNQIDQVDQPIKLNKINRSVNFVDHLLKLINIRYEKLLKETNNKNELINSDIKDDDVNCDKNSQSCQNCQDCLDNDIYLPTTSTQRYKEENNVLEFLTSDKVSESLMNDSFKPFFKLYYQMYQLLPDTYTKYFPLNKNNLPNKFQDELDDILHETINVMFMKIFEKPIELRKALRQLKPIDWVIMTFSRAKIPFIHRALDMYQCKPEHMEVLLSIVPTPIWYCPWHEDELGLTPIQTMTKYIWYFNPKSKIAEQKAVHTLISRKLSNRFRFLKIKELRYDFDPNNMFSGLAWYSSLKLSPEPDENIVENVKFDLI